MARELTDVTLSSWALPYLVPDTKLVVDELFTNALRAGLGPEPADAGHGVVRSE